MYTILHGIFGSVKVKVGNYTFAKQLWDKLQNIYTNESLHQEHMALLNNCAIRGPLQIYIHMCQGFFKGSKAFSTLLNQYSSTISTPSSSLVHPHHCCHIIIITLTSMNTSLNINETNHLTLLTLMTTNFPTLIPNQQLATYKGYYDIFFRFKL